MDSSLRSNPFSLTHPSPLTQAVKLRSPLELLLHKEEMLNHGSSRLLDIFFLDGPVNLDMFDIRFLIDVPQILYRPFPAFIKELVHFLHKVFERMIFLAALKMAWLNSISCRI